MFSYLVHYDTLLQNGTDFIIKCNTHFITKCDKSLKFINFITKYDVYYKMCRCRHKQNSVLYVQFFLRSKEKSVLNND